MLYYTGNTTGGYENQMNALLTDLTHIKDENTQLTTQLIEREEEITRKERLISLKNLKLSELDSSLRLVESEVGRMREEIEAKNQLYLTLERESEGKRVEAERVITNLRSEINTTVENLAKIHEELKDTVRSGKKASQEYDSTISQLKQEQQTLKAAHDALRLQLDQTQQSSSSTVTTLQGELAAMMTSHEEEMKLLTATFQQRRDADAQTHRDAITAKDLAIESALTEHRQSRKDHEEQVQKLTNDHQHALEVGRNEHAAALVRAEEAHQAAQAKLESDIGLLEQRVASLMSDSSQTEQHLHTQLQQCQWDLATSLQSLADVNGQLAESDARLKALELELTSQNTQLQHEKTDAIESTTKLWEERLASLQSDLEQMHTSDITGLKDSHTQAVAGLESSHASEKKALVESYELKLQELTAALTAVQSDSSHYATQLQADIERLKQEHLAAIATLKTDADAHATQHMRDVQGLQEKHALDLQSLRADHEQEHTRMTETAAAQQAELQKQHTEQMSQALDQLKATLSDEKTAAVAALTSSHTEHVSSLLATHKQAQDEYTREYTRLNTTIDDKTKRIEESEKSLNNERQDRHKRETEYVLEKDHLIREYNMKMNEQQKVHESILDDKYTIHLTELKALQQTLTNLTEQHNLTTTQYEDKIIQLNNTIQKRESRAEDLTYIQTLKTEINNKNIILEKLNEELQYIKRELNNREEVYNQKFNRSPTVGKHLSCTSHTYK